MIAILIPVSEVDPDTVRPGWVALLVILALGGATLLLWRNMGKQLKKIDFDEDRGAAPPEPESPSDLPADRQTDTSGGASPTTEPEHKLPDDRPSD